MDIDSPLFVLHGVVSMIREFAHPESLRFPALPTCVDQIFVHDKVTHPEPPYRPEIEQVVHQTIMSSDRCCDEPRNTAQRAYCKASIHLAWRVVIEIAKERSGFRSFD